MKKSLVVSAAALLLGVVNLATAEISVTDGIGRTVSLSQPAQRVVALAPHIVENLFAAGAGKQLVGVVDYSNFPAAASAIPSVGGYTSFSTEAVLALQPDLVVLWSSGNRADVLGKMESLGLTVYVDELQTLEDIANSIDRLGQLTGHADHASQVAAQFRDQLATLKTQHQGLAPVSFFYQVWDQPLQTVNGSHLISQLLEICGGQNIFAAEPVPTPKISLEAVLDANPQAIFASGMGEARPDWLEDWKVYPGLQSVQSNNLFFIPPEQVQRSTLRMLLGAEVACRSLDDARARQRDQHQTLPSGGADTVAR